MRRCWSCRWATWRGGAGAPTALYIRDPDSINRIDWAYWNDQVLQPLRGLGAWRIDIPGLPSGGTTELRFRLKVYSTDTYAFDWRYPLQVISFWIIGNDFTGGRGGDFLIHVERQYYEWDRDGLDYAWEAANGLNNDVWNDPALDSDGDGFSAWDEMVANTAPRDPASHPTIDWGWSDKGDVILKTPSIETYDYSFEYRASMQPGGFWRQIEYRACTGLPLEFRHHPPSGNDLYFYRVITWPNRPWRLYPPLPQR